MSISNNNPIHSQAGLITPDADTGVSIKGGDFTIEAWIKITQAEYESITVGTGLFNEWTADHKNFFVNILPTGNAWGEGKLFYLNGDGGVGQNSPPADDQVSDLSFPFGDSPVHVVVTREYDSLNNKTIRNVYLNGNKAFTSILDDDGEWNGDSDGLDADYDLYFGGHADFNWSFPEGSQASDLSVWSQAATDAEIEELYNNGANPQGENNMLKFKLGGLALDSWPLEVTMEVYDANGDLIFSEKPDGWDQALVDNVHPLTGTSPEWSLVDVPMGSEIAFPEQYTVRLVDAWGDSSAVESGVPMLIAINGDGIQFATIPIIGDVLSNVIGTDGGPQGTNQNAVQFEAVVAESLLGWESIGMPAESVSPKRQRTRVKAQYQVNNESDAADAAHHFVQTDGDALMADSYYPTLAQQVSTAAWLETRLNNVVGTDLVVGAPVEWADGLSYIDEPNMIGAAQQLDTALDDHVTRLAATGTVDSEGASLVGFDLHQGANGSFFIADGTVQLAIESIINEIDVFKSAETVSGSIKGTVDDAIAAAITGVPELADTIQAVADAYAAVNDEGDLEDFLGNMQGILLEMKHDIRGSSAGGDEYAKDQEYGTLLKIHGALGLREDLTTADKLSFRRAINEVDSHADHAASSLKAEYDFASGPYGATAGNYVAAGATVDAALGDLDDALMASMEAMGLTAGGEFDGLSGQQFIADSDSVEGAFIKLDDAAKNLEDSISGAHEMASGPWSAPVLANYMGEMTIASSLGKADALLKKIEQSIRPEGFNLDNGAWQYGDMPGSVYISETASISQALHEMDTSLDGHVTDLATAGEGKGANMIKVAAEAGPHVEMSGVAVLDGATVQEVIGGFVGILDVLKADENIVGSVKQIVDNNVASTITGLSGSQLAASINALADAFAAVNESDDTVAGFTGNLVSILEEIKFDIQGAEVEGDFKALEYGTLDKISDALGVRTLLEVSDDAKETFMKAINEVNLHADRAAKSLKADYDFASGVYAPATGSYILAADSTVDAALTRLDGSLKIAMDAMGLTLAGELDGLADTRFLKTVIDGEDTGFTSVEDSLIELDSELDYVRTATIDLLEGDQAMVRKGDHVEEWAVATESQTEFILSGEMIHLSSLMVFRNGLLLRKGDAYDYEVDQAGDVKIVLQGDYTADLDDEFCFKFIKKASAAYSV
jgi:hypothetical protein